MSCKSSCEIPSIDLSPYFEDVGIVVGDAPTEEQLAVAATINKACKEHGFVHVANFGISKSFGGSLFLASRDLFDNPKKTEYVPWHPSHNTGYSPYGKQSLNSNSPDLKESFNLRFPPKYDNPSLSSCPPSFQQVINDFDLLGILRLAALYGLASAVALDLPTDTFNNTLKTFNQCTVRFLHYPPCCEYDPNNPKAQPTIRLGEHTDFGMYTFLLLKDGEPMGLQVKPVVGGEVGSSDDVGWKDVVVNPLANVTGDDGNETSFSAIINTGAMMSRWTNDYWLATAHRVIVPTAGIAAQDRYSIAFFVDPDEDEIIRVDDKFAVDGKSCYQPITSKDFLLMKLKEMSKSALV